MILSWPSVPLIIHCGIVICADREAETRACVPFREAHRILLRFSAIAQKEKRLPSFLPIIPAPPLSPLYGDSSHTIPERRTSEATQIYRQTARTQLETIAATGRDNYTRISCSSHPLSRLSTSASFMYRRVHARYPLKKPNKDKRTAGSCLVEAERPLETRPRGDLNESRRKTPLCADPPRITIIILQRRE